MKILVQTLAGKSIKFRVKEAESIESLQDEQKTRGMLPDRQCLISVGKQLENTLWDNTCNSSRRLMCCAHVLACTALSSRWLARTSSMTWMIGQHCLVVVDRVFLVGQAVLDDDI